MNIKICFGKLYFVLKDCCPDIMVSLFNVHKHLKSFIYDGDIIENKFTRVIIANQELIQNPTFLDCISTYEQFIWFSLIDSLNSDNYAFNLENFQSGKLAALIVIDRTSGVKQILKPLLLMSNLWHTQNGHLCAHSSALALENKGYLFLGRSGSGKSTVAKLMNSPIIQALGDDVNYILRDGTGEYFLAAAPSSNMLPFGYSHARPKLRCIFKLVKDDKDFLLPLSVKNATKLLINSFGQTPNSAMFPKEILRSILNISAEIAQTIPGYELHFRKSPDFWKLIDEQFPD